MRLRSIEHGRDQSPRRAQDRHRQPRNRRASARFDRDDRSCARRTWGRLLGFGDIVLTGRGESAMIFARLAHPLDAKRAIEGAYAAHVERRAGAPCAAHLRPVDITDPPPTTAQYAGMIQAILTDIEGTTSSISFVKDVLFPYARKRLPAFIDDARRRSRSAALAARSREGSRARLGDAAGDHRAPDRLDRRRSQIDRAEGAAGHDLESRLRRRRISRARLCRSRRRAFAHGTMPASSSTSIRRARCRRRSFCSHTPKPAI